MMPDPIKSQRVLMAISLTAGMILLTSCIFPISRDNDAVSRRWLSEGWHTSVLLNPLGETEDIKAEDLLSGRPAHPWRSREGDSPPFVFVFELAADGQADIIRFLNGRDQRERPGIGAKEVELEFSTAGPDTGYYSVGIFSLTKETKRQEFKIPRSRVRWIRLTIHSNYGNPYFTELNKFEVFGRLYFHPPLLISHFIWIVGAAIVLAAFGWHQHLARRAGMKLRDALRLSTFTNPAKVGAVSIAVGVLASAAVESVRVPVLVVMGTIGGALTIYLYFKSATRSDKNIGKMETGEISRNGSD